MDETKTILVTTDGTEFEEVKYYDSGAQSDPICRYITNDGSKFILYCELANNGGKAFQSTDGKIWTEIGNSSFPFKDIYYLDEDMITAYVNGILAISLYHHRVMNIPFPSVGYMTHDYLTWTEIKHPGGLGIRSFKNKFIKLDGENLTNYYDTNGYYNIQDMPELEDGIWLYSSYDLVTWKPESKLPMSNWVIGFCVTDDMIMCCTLDERPDYSCYSYNMKQWFMNEIGSMEYAESGEPLRYSNGRFIIHLGYKYFSPNYMLTDSISDEDKMTLQREYPKGGLYLSTSSTNPSEFLGFGTWADISNGSDVIHKFLRIG